MGGTQNPGSDGGGARTVMARRTPRAEHPPFGAQVALARLATGSGGVGAEAAAVGAVTIPALAVERAKIERLELEVGRLRVRELVVERERSASVSSS